MTKEELVADLRLIASESEDDPEAAHVKADAALLLYINDPDVYAVWETIQMWYA